MGASAAAPPLTAVGGKCRVVFCLANGWWQTDPMPSVLCVATRSSDVPICFNYVVTRQRMGTSHLLQRPFQRFIGHGCFVLLRWRCTELSFHIMDHLIQPSPTSEDAQPQPRAVLCCAVRTGRGAEDPKNTAVIPNRLLVGAGGLQDKPELHQTRCVPSVGNEQGVHTALCVGQSSTRWVFTPIPSAFSIHSLQTAISCLCLPSYLYGKQL